jgi:hypothetical protein
MVVAKTDGIYIIHAGNDGEHRIKNSKYLADGYCEEPIPIEGILENI